MRIKFARTTALILAGAAIALAGCGTSHEDHDSGSIGVALQIAPGVVLNSVSYTITGPGSYLRTGTVNVSGSTVVATTIGGLPVGTGYDITLTATSTDGGTHCMGSATFSVGAGVTTSVSIGLVCHQGATTGSVLINGTINVCAVIDGLSANPAEAQVGGTIALSGLAHDSDAAPAALTYHWTASSGTLSDASVANPSLKCTAAGTATLTLTVSDGDCGDAQAVTVTCSGATGAGGATSAGGAGGKAGTGGDGASGGAAGAAAGGTSGAGGSAGAGGGKAGSSGTAGAAGTAGGSGTAGSPGVGGSSGAAGSSGGGGASGKTIVINEVESNGDAMGDWVELMNVSGATVDISGWKLKDDTDSHAFVVVPSGTTLASGGFYRIYVFQTFGLGAPDMARLFDPSSNLVDSYSWTTHATGTYGRCPDGTGAFVDSTPTPAAANACGGGTGAGGSGGAGGAGGAGGSGLAANEFAWPGTDTVVTVDDLGAFASNLSGLHYQPATASEPAVMWAIQNGPSKLYRLLWNGTTWESDMANSWGAGKTIHYLAGTGDPDSEGVSKAEFADSAIYVSTERDNDNNQVNRFSVLRYDTSDAGIDLTATNEWNLTADLPAMGINLGLEAITYIPDTALVAGGFFDEAASALYDPSRYPNHGAGLFFVGLESNGFIYAYALNHADNSFTRVATFSSGQVAIMDLSYDREVGYLWAQCDNTCNNKATVFKLDTTPASPTLGRFEIGRVFDRPASLPNSNFEGIGIAPESECVAGQKHFFWSDDSALDMHSLRRGSIPCGQFF